MKNHLYELTPPHVHCVETHGGGAVYTLLKPIELIKDHSEVVNDLNRRLTNFWNVLKNEEPFNQFLRIIEATPFSEWEFDKSEHFKNETLAGPIDAVEFFIQYRQSRQGLGKDFATLTRNRTRRGMNEQVSAWLSVIEGLPDIHERLKRVVILNDDACKVIKQQDGTNTFFYVDPPYLHSTRSSIGEYGKHEMTYDDHVRLLATLGEIEGKFMLSGYRSKTYDSFAFKFGWNRHEFEKDNKASSKKKKDKKIECVWMNYAK